MICGNTTSILSLISSIQSKIIFNDGNFFLLSSFAGIKHIDNIQIMRSLQKGASNRQNHFSTQLYTHSKQQEGEQPNRSSQERKKSVSSMKKYADIDKLIGEVKITPAKNNKYLQHIRNIQLELQELKELSVISDQLRTIELLVNSLTKKIINDPLEQTFKPNTKESSIRFSHCKTGSISPIKQFDDLNSQIVYTNFSIKQMTVQSTFQKECQLPKKNLNTMETIETPVKKYVFNQDQSQEIEKINSQIKVLQQLLKNKGVEEKIHYQEHLRKYEHNHQSTNSIYKNKYMQSENLCPPFRKSSNVANQSHQKISTTLMSQRKNSKGFR